MPEKKLTAAQQRAADEAAAQAEAARKQTEHARLVGAGAVLAAIALFVGGYAVGNSNDDSNRLVAADVISGQNGPHGRGGENAPRPRDGFDFDEQCPDRFPMGPRGGFDFNEQFPDGFPMGPRGGFFFNLPDDFPFGDGQGAFGFGLMCDADGLCTFQMPQGFPGRNGPFTDEAPSDEFPSDEAPAAQPGFLGVGVGMGPDGVAVEALAPGAPAETAGIQVGDVFISVDGIRIAEIGDLVEAVTDAGAGAEVAVVVDRAGQQITFNVVLNAPPA